MLRSSTMVRHYESRILVEVTAYYLIQSIFEHGTYNVGHPKSLIGVCSGKNRSSLLTVADIALAKLGNLIFKITMRWQMI